MGITVPGRGVYRAYVIWEGFPVPVPGFTLIPKQWRRVTVIADITDIVVHDVFLQRTAAKPGRAAQAFFISLSLQ